MFCGARSVACISRSRDMHVRFASSDVPFRRAAIGKFFQEPPRLENLYSATPKIRSYLKRHLPPEVFEDVDADLLRFGERTGKELWALSRECERNQPSLVQFDAWGRRDDQVITCNAWKELKAIGAEEGIVGLAYQRKHGQWSRLHQIAKMFLFHPSSAFVTCPFAMTDGAAKTIEALQLRGVPEIKEAFSRLTSMDRSNFWTSGQWMTERGGGSDVANGTETIAIQQPGDGTRFKLYGYKWFSSAIDADVTFTLARIRDGDGNTSAGTKGLSMFFAKLRDEEGRLNNMEVMKLKNKLGTKQLPTAELLLDGLDAILVSEPGHGVASISQMLTVTRLHSAIGAISAARRLMQLCRDYSCRRSAFGMMIKDSPLHMLNLSSLEIQIRAGELFLLDVSRYLGADDVGLLQKDESILFRLLTPVLKAFYAKTMVNVCCELMEAFGGQGYIEDTGIPCLVRDAQVHSIWEGTTNVLSLDVLRVLAKTKGEVLLIFNERIKRMTLDVKNAVEKRGLSDCSEALVTATTSLLKTAASTSLDQMSTGARDFTFSLAKIYSGALLLEQATSTEATTFDQVSVKRWCDEELNPFERSSKRNLFGKKTYEKNVDGLMEGY